MNQRHRPSPPKRGRPPKPPGEIYRSPALKILVRREIIDALIRLAAAERLTLAEWVRRVLRAETRKRMTPAEFMALPKKWI